MSPRPLSQLSAPAQVQVRRLCGDPLLRERLVELGFTCGQRIEVLTRGAFGGPVHVRLRGGTIAVREDEAGCVEVIGIEYAAALAATGRAAPQTSNAAAA